MERQGSESGAIIVKIQPFCPDMSMQLNDRAGTDTASPLKQAATEVVCSVAIWSCANLISPQFTGALKTQLP